MSNIMDIGLSALAAYQTSMKVASNNIANADQPYYSRRVITLMPSKVGAGVEIADISRAFDEAANRYAQVSNSDYSQWNLMAQQFGSFETLFDDDSTSVGKFINDSLSALQQIGNNFTPSNRSLVMSRFASLAAQFQSINGTINKQLINVNHAIDSQVSKINNLLSEIEKINDIVVSNSNTVQQNPEILDQREKLIQDLSQYFDFTVQNNANGSIGINLSNGMSLFGAKPAFKFVTIPDPANSENLILGVNNGTTTINVTNLLQSGELAGLINFRSTGLESAKISLGRLALVFADKLNTQNKLGIDANANLGVNIFKDINTASAMANRIVPNINNTGVAAMDVHIDNVTNLYPNDYQIVIGAANAYTVIRKSDTGNTVVGTGTIGALPQTIDLDGGSDPQGFSITLNSGTFNAGDSFLLSPTRGAADNVKMEIQDPSDLALGWPVNASQGVKKSQDSDGVIEVTAITDTTNAAFATPKTLSPPIEIRFSVVAGVTTYSLWDVNASTYIQTNIPYTPGADIFPTPAPTSYDPGYQVKISGNNIQDGDTFNLTYNSNPISDNRNAQAMTKLYAEGTMLGSNGLSVSFSKGYELLSSAISVKTNNAMKQSETFENVKKQAENIRQEISGVSLEREVLTLTNLQVAYQASAQVLQVARSVFDIISSIAR